MVDLAVAVLIVVIGAWIVVHEEMAGRGLLPSQPKKPQLLQQLRRKTSNQKGS